MKKLGIDGRSAEERYLDDIKQEEEEKKNESEPRFTASGIPIPKGHTEIIMNPGMQGPQVSIIIDRKKNFNPKQNL